MTDFIKRLSPRAEFIVVLCVGFGEFLLSNAMAVLNPSMSKGAFTDASVLGLAQFEIAIACVVGLFLYLRGWRLSNLGAPFKASDPIVMVGLMLATYVVTGLFWQAAVVIEPTLGSVSANELMGGKLSLGNVVLLSVVNPIFEEALLCGYIVTALKERRGFWFTVNVSVALRVANHLYQGSMGVLSILPLGLLFTVWYARTNRLWPVILAHAAFDLIALWPHIGTVE